MKMVFALFTTIGALAIWLLVGSEATIAFLLLAIFWALMIMGEA